MKAVGRPREFDREVALKAALCVFWRKGYLATSLNDLCAAMGIRSPSLYAAFGSKEAIYLEAVNHYSTAMAPLVWGRLADGSTAREGVENVLLAAVAAVPQGGATPAGCMVALSAVGEEYPGGTAEVMKSLRAQCLDGLRSRLDEAVHAGELPTLKDAERLARFYMGVYQAIAIQARDGTSHADLLGIVETAMAAWPRPSAT